MSANLKIVEKLIHSPDDEKEFKKIQHLEKENSKIKAVRKCGCR